MKNLFLLLFLFIVVDCFVSYGQTKPSVTPAPVTEVKPAAPVVTEKPTEVEVLKYKNLELQYQSIITTFNGLKQVNEAQFMATEQVKSLQTQIDTITKTFTDLNEQVMKAHNLDSKKFKLDSAKGEFVEVPTPPASGKQP